MTRLTRHVEIETEQRGCNHALAPEVMRMNAANLYDYFTGAGIHAAA